MNDSVQELRDLVAVMRELGVTTYEHDGKRVELGAAPAPTSPPITDAQRREIAQKTKEQSAALLYASSEGFLIDEEGAPL